MKNTSIVVLLLLSFIKGNSQTFYVKERIDNLENIIKRALAERADSLTELEAKADYVIKIEAETRAVLERGTVKAVLASTSTGKILFETNTEKVASNNGVPTSGGIRRALKRIVSNNLDQMTSIAKSDYLTSTK